MLVDAAKHGDVEIPYFCYEPKLGNPVGACRMCLVEIEGIPKLQTSCSTPVKDGMVVHTQTDRVHHAQNAIVEFLLVNHPLDCPVCDKGGECPLQDITFGWGLGPLALHRAQAPLREAAGALAADRDRPRALHPLLPLRALLAGDRRGLPADLHRARRPHVRRHPRRPSVRGAVQRQHHRAVPGRRADLPALPLPRPAVGHRGRGRDLHAVPVAVQRRVHRPRREGDARARARATPSVDDGWLCDKGRFAYQAIHVDERITAPLVRDGGELAAGLVGARAGGRGGPRPARGPRRRARRRPGDQRGGLPAPAPAARGPRLGTTSTRGVRRAVDRSSCARALAAPALQATVPDLEFAHTVLVLGCEPLDDAPILDLRIRKGVRRHGVKLAIATARPSALDPNAELVAPLRPGRRGRVPGRARLGRWRATPAIRRRDPRLAELLRDGGEDVVILWGERLAPTRSRRCCASPSGSASPSATAPGCSRSRPAPTGAGCARRACCPDAGSRLRLEVDRAGRGARREIARGRRRRRDHRAVPVPDRPGPRPARPRAVGAGARIAPRSSSPTPRS